MHSVGSKLNHAAEIIRIVTASRKSGQVYCEPFVGGGNVICRVPREQGPRIGADKNKYMIALLDAVGNRGWVPETMSRPLWNKIKKNPENYPPELVAFAATACSFGSIWFQSYVLDNPRAKETFRDFEASRKAVLRDAPGLCGIEFRTSDFAELDIPLTSVVYCDPPYAETDTYKGAKTKITVGESLAKNEWNRTKFWKWADKMVDAGHQVFVSEYQGPAASIYNVTSQELKNEDHAICALGKALDERKRGPSSNWPTPEECEVLFARRRALDQREHEERARLAARWQVLWSKKAAVEINATQGKVAEGKMKEITELLLHRVP
jgi:DNA adenine methylase